MKRFTKDGFCLYDRLRRRLNRLQRVGPLLLIGHTRYRGPARVFADNTHLKPGDLVGPLHLDNERIAGLYKLNISSTRIVFKFARLFRESLQALAIKVKVDSELSNVVVYHGVTWFRPHGQGIGFQVEALPNGPKTRLLYWHFRLLLYAFVSEYEFRQPKAIQPHAFWLTRQQLMRHFSKEALSDSTL